MKTEFTLEMLRRFELFINKMNIKERQECINKLKREFCLTQSEAVEITEDYFKC